MTQGKCDIQFTMYNLPSKVFLRYPFIDYQLEREDKQLVELDTNCPDRNSSWTPKLVARHDTATSRRCNFISKAMENNKIKIMQEWDR